MTAATHRSGDGTGHAADGRPELAAAIRAALGHLTDLTDPPEAVRDGRLDEMLRAALQAHGGPTSPATDRAPAPRDGHRTALDEAAAAVRTACAHLAASELEDAYLALRAAVDRLPPRAAAAAAAGLPAPDGDGGVRRRRGGGDGTGPRGDGTG